VLGYDLLNEPISPYSDENYLNPRLEGTSNNDGFFVGSIAGVAHR
jgi:hypothetical protein